VHRNPPPLLGFNNNVRHKGRLFHIQTEDSGVKYQRVVTHLFADGGRIVKTTRTDYSKHVGATDMADVVKALMKKQHKGMFLALREGEFDELVEHICGPFPEPGSRRKAEASSPKKSSPSNAQPKRTSPPPRRRSSRPRAATAAAEEVGRASIPSGRPSSHFGELPSPNSRSIFGDEVVSEKSLDEVILSYLADDLEGDD
jgi:hypothetical protein